jgi:hypothetical protein
MMTPVKVKCKRCGREFKSDEFTLDPVYKMMVCRECVKERRTQEFAAKKNQQREQTKVAMETQIKRANPGFADSENKGFLKKEKPAGWDAEDAEIERSYKAKKAALPDVEKIDDQRVKYTCK